MIDPIVQDVRDARAAIAAEFNYDLGKYLAWIREQTEARKTAMTQPRAKKETGKSGRARKSAVTRKGRAAPARVSA
jgi:hypothetical protein